MNASGLIAGGLKFKGKAAFRATALSAFVMVVAVCVSAGFRSSIRDTIRSIAGDALVCHSGSGFLSGDIPVSDSLPVLGSISGIESVEPVIFKTGALKIDDVYEGVIFKGVEKEGTLSALIPSSLARNYNLKPGDRLTAYFVSDKVKARNFTVEGTYESADLKDALIIECPIADLRRLNAWDENSASALELKFSKGWQDASSSSTMAAMVGATIYGDGSDLVCISTADHFRDLYNWLDVIDTNVLAILILMSIVAAFNMISAVLILLMQSVSTIGTLKTMGMTDRDIAGIFLKVGARKAGLGILVGAFAGTAVCFVQQITHLLKLNAENYFISYVPIHINIPMIVLTGIIVWGVTALLLLIPCLYISRIDPAETVKAE